MDRKQLGALGEKLAADLLKKRGYRILERNYRCREGEIDIVARQGDCLVFVEVRTKTGGGFGSPEESVTAAKKGKLVTAALSYLQGHRGPPADWRIDMVAVELGPGGRPLRIEVIESAVEG
ncbi:MAG: YraN family protein [Chloroflexota bacterium]